MRQQNILYRYSAFVIIICICVVLGCSVSYARYRSNFMTSSYWFTSSLTENIHIHGEVTEAEIDQVQAGVWPQVPAAWSYTTSEALLKFSVSNGYSGEEYSTRDQGVTIELVALLAIEDPENLKVTLTVTDMSDTDEEGAYVAGESVQYTGVAGEIVAGSRYASAYGEGWIYRFYDEEDNELLLPLEGGALVYKNCTLSVSGTGNASLLSLELSAKYTDM